MKHLMHFLAVLAICLFGTGAAVAQDDDKGFLTRKIQDVLSGAGRSVSIDGFRGALSSTASFDRMTIADREGIWLTLEDVVLDWNRSALLRGRLEVEALTAARLDLPRLPVSEGVELPDAEATPFSLPELPVSINIEDFGVDEINLGAPLLGEAAQLRVQARAQYTDELLDVDINAVRTDDQRGEFAIRANFERADNVLDLLVQLSEGEGGLVSKLLNLPDQPSIELTVEGNGPLDDFETDVTVATDGQDRLAGQVSVGTQAARGAAAAPDRRIQADIGGDITALLAPRFREFFGEDVSLTIDALVEGSGAIEVSSFDLNAQAANLVGQVRLNADKWPTFIDISGTVANPDNTSIVLPVGGEGTTVEGVELRVNYDAADGDALDAVFDITALQTATATISNAQLNLDGILQGAAGAARQFQGDVTFDAGGLVLKDAAIAEAAGNKLTGQANINYTEGQPTRVTGFNLTGTDYGLTGEVIIAGLEENFRTQLDLALEASDLSRFSALAGRELDGQTGLAVNGNVTPLGGMFDLQISGSTQDLRLGIEQADAVLAGLTELSLQTMRDESGTFVRDLVLENDALSLTGAAELRTDNSRVQADFKLADVGLVLPQYEGPITVSAVAIQDARGWSVDADTDGPYGATISVDGLVTGPNAAIEFTADVPDAQPFVEQIEGPVRATGTLRQTPEGWRIETDAAGPYDLSASVEGQVTPTLDIDFDLSVPEINPLVPQVSGPLNARGNLRQTEDGYVVDTEATGPYDARFTAQGAITPAVDIRFDLDLPDVQPLAPQVEGPLNATGTLRQTEDGFVIDTEATGPYDTRLDVQGTITPSVEVRFDVSLPDVQPLVPQVEGPLNATGTLRQTDDGFVIDTDATGPYDARLNVEGAITPTIDVRFDVSLPNVNPLVPQVDGPLNATGSLRQTDDGFVIDTEATGPYSTRVDVQGAITPAVDIRFDVSVPNVQPLVPQVNGPLNASGSLRQTDRGFVVDTEATGPYGARAMVAGLATGPDMSLSFDVSVPNVNPLVPGVNGPLSANGTLSQTPDGLAVDTQASGPYSAQANVQGVVTGPNAAVTFSVAMPNIGAIVPRVNGPFNVQGSARKQGSAWQIDTNAQGPSGTQATVAGQVGADGNLNLDIAGTAPLGLSRPFIAPRDLQGQVRFDLSVDGPPALSSVSGTIRTSDASLSAPTLRVALNGINADIQLANNRANIDLSANVVSGGQVRVAGGVTLTGALPADIQIALQNIELVDPDLYSTRISGALRLAGPLTGGARITGQIDVGETNVNVPSTGLTSIGDIPPITHVNAPADVIVTRRKAGLDGAGAGNDPTDSGGGVGYGLDVRISAPNRIFVRGRGLDAELGGALNLTGTTNDIISIGRFELIRGRLDILGRRFVLEEGSVQFQGDFIPYLRFVSTTSTDSTDISIIIQGPANDPEVTFESSPDLPQDEVLAQLLFGRDIADISAFQALQLASAVATLAGRGGVGIVSNLRESFGLDDLDVTTTDDGATAVRAGKYISENVYSEVTAASDGSADVSLNIDLTEHLKGKATLGSDGNTGIGLFYERDY